MDASEPFSDSPVLAEHIRNPRNRGLLESADGHARITGPCGDTMEFWVRVRGDRLARVAFETSGCGATVACGSMATTLAEGLELTDAIDLQPEQILAAVGGLPAEYEHCAQLACDTLHGACEDYLFRQVRRTQAPPAKGDCDSCGDSGCSAAHRQSGESDKEFEERRQLQARLCRIRHKLVVLSGKGGVGKSTVAVNLAVALLQAGQSVGLLDVDIHGPSIPTMLGLEGEAVHGHGDELIPVDVGGLKVLSIGFFLRHPDDAVIWRGPMKYSAIRQFLKDGDWGDLDYLVIDSPPGTGDEPLSVCHLIGALDGAVVVTTPQRVAAVDVRKSINFCRQLGVPVLGVVENMSGFACPHCGEVTPIFRTGGGKQIAADMDVPFLGSIPIDPVIAEACDAGRAFIHHYAASPTAAVMREIIGPLMALDFPKPPAETVPDSITQKENIVMRIAIPLADGKLALHFGHCERFALVDADPATQQILKREDVEAPPHQPGLLPPWLAERGVQVVIAGGMGQRAVALFNEQGIRVHVGAPAETPEDLVQSYLRGSLQLGGNVCDH
jgi:Mrp family chromosome partitioning ATPase/predicted Fe-Mo cluster-binding NifX family protein